MASPEGPTPAVTQAVNLSVNENTNKMQAETQPLPSHPSDNANAASVSSTSSEKISTPMSVGTATETSAAPVVNNTAPNIPVAPSKALNLPENTEPKPGNGIESTAESASGTEMDTSDSPKTSGTANAGVTKTTSGLENSNHTKVLETTSVTKENTHQNCDVASENNMNCDNTLPTASQEKKVTSEQKESVQIPTETPGTTPNIGVPKIDVPPSQTTSVSKPVATIKPMVDSAANSSVADESKLNMQSSDTKTNNKRPAEDSDEPDKRQKTTSSPSHPSSSLSGYKGSGKTPEQILEYMEKTFEHRRKIITKQMPTIPELKEMYPDLFRDKQLVIEFQRITKIDIDQKVQEFCVRNATAVIEMARSKKGAAPVLARWVQAKQENEALKQYWDMVTALCLLPLHFGENFVEMVLEIGEDEEVQAQGKIVPTLVARGNVFRTDEFFLIAENTIVQEFEEFTIAFASLYSSYWVFNMVYPETIENTYNFIQRCIVKQKEPGAIPTVCKNFTKTLQKWNKTMKKT